MGFLFVFSNADISRTRPPTEIPRPASCSATKSSITNFRQKSALTHLARVGAKTGSTRLSTIARERRRIRTWELRLRIELEKGKRTIPFPTPRRHFRPAPEPSKSVKIVLQSSNAMRSANVKPEELFASRSVTRSFLQLVRETAGASGCT